MKVDRYYDPYEDLEKKVIKDIVNKNTNPNFIEPSDCPIKEYLKPSII